MNDIIYLAVMKLIPIWCITLIVLGLVVLAWKLSKRAEKHRDE